MSTTLSCETCDAQNLSVYFESNDQKKLEYDGVRLSSSLGCQFCSLLKEAAEIVVKLVNSANTKTSAPVRADSIALSPPQNFDQTLNIAVCLDVSKSTKTPGMTVNSYRLQLFTSYGVHSPWPLISNVVEIEDSLDARSASLKIGQWLRSCSQNHLLCQVTESIASLPKRVLQIDGSQGSQVCLLETTNESGKYVVLSHCWGNPTPPIPKTIAANIEQRKRCIEWKDIPKTFQDAISISRELGYKYLWIDCFCIVQDSEADWEEQSALMSDIYHQSDLSIAALSASDCHSGILNHRWVRPSAFNFPGGKDHQFTQLTGTSFTINITDNGKNIPIQLRFNRGSHRPMLSPILSSVEREDAPLLARAWAFQERCLAPRKVLFHHDEMFWECQTGLDCECGVLTGKPVNDAFCLPGSDATTTAALLSWYLLLLTYSGLKLSYQSDRLPALSGIAVRYQRLIPGRYIAGMWEAGLVEALLWSCRGSGPSTRPRPLLAPTWSWASVTSRHEVFNIYNNFLFSHGLTQDPELLIIGVDIPSNIINQYGQVKSGTLRLRGVLIHATLQHNDTTCNHNYGRYGRMKPKSTLMTADTTTYFDSDVDYHMRTKEPLLDGDDAVLVRMGTNKYKNTQGEECEDDVHLVLRKSTESLGNYERLGMQEFSNSLRTLDSGTVDTINIV